MILAFTTCYCSSCRMLGLKVFYIVYIEWLITIYLKRLVIYISKVLILSGIIRNLSICSSDSYEYHNQHFHGN